MNDRIIEYKPFEKEILEYQNIINGQQQKDKKRVSDAETPVSDSENTQRNKKQEIRNKKLQKEWEENARPKGKNDFYPTRFVNNEDINKSPPDLQAIIDVVSSIKNVPRDKIQFLSERYYFKRTETGWKKTNGASIRNFEADINAWISKDLQDLQTYTGNRNGHNGNGLPAETDKGDVLAEWESRVDELR